MIYTEQEKKIFVTAFGQYDPLRICNQLVIASKGQWNNWLKSYYEPESDVERAGAALQIASVARSVFELKPLTGDGGYGDAVVLEVVDQFMEFVTKKG